MLNQELGHLWDSLIWSQKEKFVHFESKNLSDSRIFQNVVCSMAGLNFLLELKLKIFCHFPSHYRISIFHGCLVVVLTDAIHSVWVISLLLVHSLTFNHAKAAKGSDSNFLRLTKVSWYRFSTSLWRGSCLESSLKIITTLSSSSSV